MRIVVLVIVVFLAVACGKHPYVEMEEREMASGLRYDSLFLGLSLGMERKAFFDRCWELNKQKLIMQGPGNNTVEYRLENGTDYPIIMHFYPSFHEDRAYEVPMTIYYEAWAPWNKHLGSDSLKEEVKALMERWYGEGFVNISHPSGKSAYAKVNGNRRISISTVDERRVKVLFTDLTIEKKLKL